MEVIAAEAIVTCAINALLTNMAEKKNGWRGSWVIILDVYAVVKSDERVETEGCGVA